MPRHAWIVLAGFALAGCDNGYEYSGFQMTDFFPMDGTERSLTYSTVENLDYDLKMTMLLDSVDDRGEGLRVVTFSHEKLCREGVEECGAGFVYDFKLSSDDTRGTLIHGYERADGPVVFDTPLTLAKVRMAFGDTQTTVGVDGHDFTTTYNGNVDCEDTLNVDWECAHLTLESTPAGHWLAGEWYATPGYNLVSFQRTEDTGRWITTDWSYVQ